MSTLIRTKQEIQREWPGVGEYGVVPIDSVVPNPRNSRKYIDQDGLHSLSTGMKKGGQREIITVRPLTLQEIEGKYPHARYMIISGERRWHSAKKAFLATIEIRVRGYENTAAEVLDVYMLNADREPLSDLEEAWAIQDLIELHGWKTHEEISANTNHDTTWVSQTLALLKLSPAVQDRMHPRLKPKERLKKQVGVFLSRLTHETQNDLIRRMPGDLETTATQLTWLRAEIDVKGVDLPTRERKPVTLRRIIESFTNTMQQKAEELLSSAELNRLFENTDDARAKAFATRLQRAHSDFGTLVTFVNELAKREKKNTMIVAREHMGWSRPSPGICEFQLNRRERKLISVLWFNEISQRYLADEVTHEQYAAIFDRNLFKFQREGSNKPFHYPDRNKILVTC